MFCIWASGRRLHKNQVFPVKYKADTLLIASSIPSAHRNDGDLFSSGLSTGKMLYRLTPSVSDILAGICRGLKINFLGAYQPDTLHIDPSIPTAHRNDGDLFRGECRKTALLTLSASDILDGICRSWIINFPIAYKPDTLQKDPSIPSVHRNDSDLFRGECRKTALLTLSTSDILTGICRGLIINFPAAYKPDTYADWCVYTLGT